MKKLIVTARIDGQTHSDLKMIAKREDRSVSYLLSPICQYRVRHLPSVVY